VCVVVLVVVGGFCCLGGGLVVSVVVVALCVRFAGGGGGCVGGCVRGCGCGCAAIFLVAGRCVVLPRGVGLSFTFRYGTLRGVGGMFAAFRDGRYVDVTVRCDGVSTCAGRGGTPTFCLGMSWT